MSSTISADNISKVKEILGANSLGLADSEVKAALIDATDGVYSKIRYAVLNAISHEYAAILAIFGQPRTIPSREHVDSAIKFIELTTISGSKRYVAFSGITGQGIAQSAALAATIKYKCRFVDKIVLVGIAAGQPNLEDKEKDVRLGDIVVGNKIIQYDHVKLENGRQTLRGDGLNPGDSDLLAQVNELRALQELRGAASVELPWMKYIHAGAATIRSAKRPEVNRDPHHNKRNYKSGLEQDRDNTTPYVHVGTIGSASTLLKDPSFRDSLHERYGTIAYEMEGAGLAIAAQASGVAYLMVRGVCDYGDANKNNDWQTYSSVCAAAFARAVLEAD